MYSKRNNENFETYSLIWVDATINFQENIDAQEKLRSSINYLRTFDKLDQFQKYIQSSSTTDDRIVLIVSGQLAQQLIPEIHKLRQIYSIYIYCTNNEFHQQWSQKYKKIKDVHSRLDKLITQIQTDHSNRRRRHIDDEPLSILIYKSETNPEKSTTGIDGRFVQYQLLISCLLKLKETTSDKRKFLRKCRQYYEKNQTELDKIDDFEKKYEAEHCLWWYTKDSFIYRLLNRALRTQNIDLLFLLRFFLRDMQNELDYYRYSSPTHLYRGQLMAKDELDELKNSQGRLISITSFLSTSFKFDVARFYLHPDRTDEHLEKVLFEIYADPCLNGIKPFADISKISKFSEELEVLMMLGSVFRLNKIYFDDEHQYWHINMTLCSDHDCELKSTIYHMKNQYGTIDAEYLALANVLIDMGYFDQAEKYLCPLSKQLPPNHKDLPECYHALGKIWCEKGNYSRSLDYFDKAIKSLQDSKSNNSRIGYIYNNIGEVYQNMNDTKRALKAYKKALNIFRKTFTGDEESIAWCYNNLGIIYEKQMNYPKAYTYLAKALNIKLKVLPLQHPCLGNTYNNLGNVYLALEQYDLALNQYRSAYEIFQKSLEPFHPSNARIRRNIGLAYEASKQFDKAKIYYKQALDIRRMALSSDHPDLKQTKRDIQRISSKIKSIFYYSPQRYYH